MMSENQLETDYDLWRARDLIEKNSRLRKQITSTLKALNLLIDSYEEGGTIAEWAVHFEKARQAIAQVEGE